MNPGVNGITQSLNNIRIIHIIPPLLMEKKIKNKKKRKNKHKLLEIVKRLQRSGICVGCISHQNRNGYAKISVLIPTAGLALFERQNHAIPSDTA